MKETQRARLLRKICAALAKRYGTPRLGNLRNPVSELVFIILSARTRGRSHEAAYRSLRSSFGSWDAVADARVSAISRTIRDAGLSRVKAVQIKGLLLKLRRDFGQLSGRTLSRFGDKDLEAYLTQLPGVGVKTARCVMMYSLDRQVFPVDTHCIRLFLNLGMISRRPRFEYAQDPIQEMVPTAIRRALHVNAVAHGRITCIPGAERCDRCVISNLCRNRKPGVVRRSR